MKKRYCNNASDAYSATPNNKPSHAPPSTSDISIGSPSTATHPLNPIASSDLGAQTTRPHGKNKAPILPLLSQHPIVTSPNLLNTKTMRKRGREINNAEPKKSWINPHLKKIKKGSKRQEIDTEYCLPIDYCEELRAYYQEIDDFELLEEEISY